MVRRVDLYDNPTPNGVREFVNNVVDLAIADHQMGRPRRSGSELTDMFASECRRGHTRLASGIYNKVRWTFDRNYNG